VGDRPTPEMVNDAIRRAGLVANPEWGWLADEVLALRTALADSQALLKRWTSKPTVVLTDTSNELHNCDVLDVSHSEPGLLIKCDTMNTALARVEGEKNEWMQRAAKGAESFNAALSDCRILLAECEAARLWREAPPHECDGSDPHGACAACEMSDLWAEARAATDASGARARHAKGGGA
jgi:hypothetical protein